MSRRIIYLWSVIAASLLISACATTEEDPTKDWSPQRFYVEAKNAFAAGNKETAIKYFEQLEARYPYGRYAEQAQLEVAYVYYKHEEPELALSAANRFIRLHPTHANIDYVYYLKGLINFNNRGGTLGRMLGIETDVADRDPRAAREAFNTFRELVNKFPRSRYAPDARKRAAYLLDSLARHEIKVAQYYLKRKAHTATLNRCKIILEKYQRTRSVEDALGIMAVTYGEIGLDDLRKDTLRVLSKNFPNSDYLKAGAADLARTKEFS
ncbi:MAG: outer membrane protein assembly factor BamD [Gammaproteobacteria bacterium]|nr:outer membrane protein assembly factor BamD [Gammaproteobacteria bacterium]